MSICGLKHVSEPGPAPEIDDTVPIDYGEVKAFSTTAHIYAHPCRCCHTASLPQLGAARSVWLLAVPVLAYSSGREAIARLVPADVGSAGMAVMSDWNGEPVAVRRSRGWRAELRALGGQRARVPSVA